MKTRVHTQKVDGKSGMAAHAFSPSTWEAEVGKSLWSWGQKGLHSETLTKKLKKNQQARSGKLHMCKLSVIIARHEAKTRERPQSIQDSYSTVVNKRSHFKIR